MMVIVLIKLKNKMVAIVIYYINSYFSENIILFDVVVHVIDIVIVKILVIMIHIIQ